MERILYLISWDMFLNITNKVIIIFMITSTISIYIYSKSSIFKFRYVCLLGAVCGVGLALWSYAFLPVHDDAKTPLVGIYVFMVRFLAYLFWGSATWIVLRYIYKRKLTRQLSSRELR
jgi:uncharacterized membrane protein YfcA